MTPRSVRAVPCSAVLLALVTALGVRPAAAQENYEIQVYGSETMEAGHTIFELHSNFTSDGSKVANGTMLATNHALHETIEITHGFNSWFEVGWYIFTSVPSGGGWNWVGDHIRPRVRAPESWGWPVGASLSVEAGYQRDTFADDTWNVEIRPIIDKQLGRLYWAFNPTMGLSLKNAAGEHQLVFEPNADVGFDVTPQVNLSVEYYGAMGPVSGFLPSNQQEHQVYPAVNLNLSPRFEFNFGVGFNLTDAGDNHVIKMITGYRF